MTKVRIKLETQLRASVRMIAMAVGACAAMLIFVGPTQTAMASGETRSLRMLHLHTKETIDVTYKRNGQYDPDALKKLDWFLRDWRQEQSTRMDPKLFDTIWAAYREVGATQPIQIVCGYRAPATNAMLRRRSRGVAKFSQHTLGKAIDFYIPGVDLSALRVAGLRQQRGGVGFYPSSGSPFVHMDVGNVRMWPRMTREQLASVFPDGRTVHVPSDGRPMPRYQEAYAALKRNGTLASSFAGLSDDDDDNTSASSNPVLASYAAPGPATLTRSLEPQGSIPLPAPRPTDLGSTSTSQFAIAQQQPALAWQTGASPTAGSSTLFQPGAAILASADPMAPTLTRRLTTAPPTKPAVGYATSLAAYSNHSKPPLIATRFERLNFAALSTMVPAARDKAQARFIKPDLNSIRQLIRSPNRIVMMKFGVTANQDMRVAQFTGAAIKPLRVANLSGSDQMPTGALAFR